MKINYEFYIKSTEWQIKRQEFIGRHKTKKCFCGSDKNLHVHHATYERMGNELDSDLRLVCNKCHEMIHYFHKNMIIPSTLEKATNMYISFYISDEEFVQITKNEKIPLSAWNLIHKNKDYQVVKNKRDNRVAVNVRRKNNKDKKKSEIDSILSQKSWSNMTRKEKKIVDFKRYKKEKQMQTLDTDKSIV